MKFARDFKQTLATRDFPSHWVENAIPYSQLKKCLKKVEQELRSLGLDSETLKSLVDSKNASPVAINYRLITSNNSDNVRPDLTVDIHLGDGVVLDASLTPALRPFFEKISFELSHNHSRGSVNTTSSTNTKDANSEAPKCTGFHSGQHDKCNHKTVKMPLVFDNMFFQMLQCDINNIDTLQASEREQMTQEIATLGEELTHVTKPRRFHKTDMVPWRDIFELYLGAEAFFATHEQEHGTRSSQAALQQLRWFQNEIQKRDLTKSFRLSESRAAFSRFLRLNSNLLKMLQFQELNQLAVLKILKKFDKRTSFSISNSFRSVIQAQQLMTGNIGKDICAQMSQELTTVTPQLNDYLCPICFMVAFRPVRLDCNHIFCLRCIVKIQLTHERHCPICRADVVMKATIDNLDNELAGYMKKHFAKEISEKERADDIERGREVYGASYTPQECTVM